ncbi:translation initiation factor IF-2-like isoform X1 [Bubalus kerabau]|uniref:translation initiation factor IF-2-like isoform X1 n=1 Tax=Bubalus carabanensis TaxID=3119969 RepID=UPI00244EF33C|nr:translation initiation factor IF-2-like isoform X1 [Bubalus carabanensis]
MVRPRKGSGGTEGRVTQVDRQHLPGPPQAQGLALQPLSGRHPYRHRDSRYIVHMCPPGHKHQCKGQRNKESHEFAPTGTTQSRSAHSQGPHQQTAFTGATPGVPPPPGRGLPSDQKAGAPVWVSRGQDSHLTKARILRAQPQKGAQQEPRRLLAPASRPGWAGGPRFQRAGCPPSQLDTADGPRPRSGQAARVSARSRSPPCRPPISPSLAEAPPVPNGKAPLPARAERCAATAGTGSAASPLSTGHERGAAGAGGVWGWARPGPRPPSLALARPGNRAAAGAGPGMRTAASLAVKLTPGEGAGGQHPSPHPRRLSSATGL